MNFERAPMNNAYNVPELNRMITNMEENLSSLLAGKREGSKEYIYSLQVQQEEDTGECFKIDQYPLISVLPIFNILPMSPVLF